VSIRNADLTREHVLRLVTRLGYEDITDQVRGDHVLVVHVPVSDEIVAFDDLPHARRFLQGDLSRRKLDVRVFQSWLAARFDQVVGVASSGQACPLAWFLSGRMGLSYEVGVDIYYPVGTFPDGALALPVWACLFVRRLDFTSPLVGGVTGEQALRVLQADEGFGGWCSSHRPGGWGCVTCRNRAVLLSDYSAVFSVVVEGGCHD